MSNKKKKHPWSGLLAIVGVVLAIVILNQCILINCSIPSASMEPQIQEGNRIIGNRLAYISAAPERFDVVIFRYPDDESQLFIKRIIGLPGETVTIKDGKVYIDDPQCQGEPLDDSFCPEEPEPLGEGNYEVPEGCYFMLGDNRNHSFDSRFWDSPYVPKENIVAETALKYWPLTEMTFID